MKRPSTQRAVAAWLLTGAVLIAVMVTVGGVTRLTGSGLSITEWAPLMGALPPLTESAWVELFAKYRATPQFEQLNPHFTLDDFKTIFWWEYLHRLLGRLLGVVFIVPFLWFVFRRAFTPALRNRVLFIFALGAFQGALGWFMVASGLVDRPNVSHYRLAAHLLTAFFTLAVTLWVALGVLAPNGSAGRPVPPALHLQARLFAVLFGVQALYGAFVAGLKAGFAFNTFPLMAGTLAPGGLLALAPVWRNLTENPVTVQFVHRMLAWLLLAFGVWLWHSLRVRGVRREGNALLAALALQFALGVGTILRLPFEPVLWGTLHQAGAVLLLASMVWMLFRIRRHAPELVPAPAVALAA